jgi:hypothetical protein
MEHYVSKRNLLGSALFLLCLVSCATKPKPSPFSPVYLTDKAIYTLLPPSDIAVPLDNHQRITGAYGKQEFSIDAWVMADDREITMAFFNSMGTGLGELSFNEGGIAFSSAVFPVSFKPEYIIADFQLCFYRSDAVSRALENCGLNFRVEQRIDDGGEAVETRVVSEGKKNIIEIEKRKTSARFTSHIRGYGYTLEGDF